MSILLGLTGPAGCGKDTIADRLFGCHGFLPMAFAQPLRFAAVEAFGIDYHDFVDRDKKDIPHPYWGLTPRQILQRLGTEAMRGVFGEDFWIKRWLLTYAEVGGVSNVVLTDVRFENEAATLRERGGRIVHVSRPGLENVEGAHASARGVAFVEGDLTLDNGRDLKHLYAEVDAMAEALHVR